MDRLLRKNVLAMSGRAVEAAGDVDTLLLDKTGTITLGNRMATEFLPLPGVRLEELAEAAQLASLADETPEGRSIVVAGQGEVRPRAVATAAAEQGTFVPFTAQTRMSGLRSRRGGRSAKARSTPVGKHVEAAGRHGLRPSSMRSRPASATEAARRSRSPTATGAGRHSPQGRGQGRHQGALRPLPRHGHPHGHDHRRQPAHRRGHRPRGRRRRLPGRGDARDQDAPHPGRAGRRASWWR